MYLYEDVHIVYVNNMDSSILEKHRPSKMVCVF